MLKSKDIRGMSEPDLKARCVELKKELMKNYAEIARGTMIKNAGKIRAIKKTLARIYTNVNERTMAKDLGSAEKSKKSSGVSKIKNLEVKKKDE